MRSQIVVSITTLSGLLLFSAAVSGDTAAQKPPSNAQLIASAVSAAPPEVARGAGVIMMGNDGKSTMLRASQNGFTCMPDNPATPGPDPMCMDKAAMAWVEAWVGKRPPASGGLGLMYMLEGGTDASNTDPYATAPSGTNHWIETGPHLMIVGADPAFYAAYPGGEDPQTGAPYVMWANTPYQHLMVPVR